MRPFGSAVFLASVLAASVCFAQGGIYSICDPRGRFFNSKLETKTLGEVIGREIKDISIIESAGWKDAGQAKAQLTAKLQDSAIEAYSCPIWNMDIPVDLVGVIEYRNGFKGKIAVAAHRVGFQDSRGRPWYFQWNERIPWKDRH